MSRKPKGRSRRKLLDAKRSRKLERMKAGGRSRYAIKQQVPLEDRLAIGRAHRLKDRLPGGYRKPAHGEGFLRPEPARMDGEPIFSLWEAAHDAEV